MSTRLRPYPEYRSSGLAWLGRVPAHWDVVRNGRLFAQRVEIGFPGLPILEVSLRTGVRVRDMEGGRKQQMTDRAKYKRAARGDLAYNIMRMWQGAAGTAPCDGLVSPAYVVARPLPGVDTRYYAYLFRTAAYMREVELASRGIVPDRNRLYWQDFKALLSPMPPLEEQRRIADFLDAYTARVLRYYTAKRNVVAALIERKQRVLIAMLRDGFDQGTSVAHDLAWIDQRPSHWDVCRLKVVAQNVAEVAGATDDDTHRVTLDRVEPWTGRVTPGDGTPTTGFAGKRFLAGDVLFGKLRPYLAKVVRCDRPGLAGSEFLVLRANRARLAPRFLEQLLRAKPFIDYVATMGAGAKMPRVEWDAISSIKVALPDLPEQEEICSQFELASREIDCAVAKLGCGVKLALEYRDATIASIVFGRLDVRRAEAMTVEAAPMPPQLCGAEEMEEEFEAAD